MHSGSRWQTKTTIKKINGRVIDCSKVKSVEIIWIVEEAKNVENFCEFFFGL